MSTAGRRAEFFALEANEYLNDLAPLAQARDLPDAERLVRGARALRGAALMAGLGTYARAAAGLEALARQVREHALAWEPGAREGWTDGLATLRGLVTRAATWEAADDRQALALAERLERIAGGHPTRSATPVQPALTPGVRAFIARESTLIAGSLEQAANALSPVPPPAALAAVLERMQSLRGLGTSAELSPLPELLDAMEVATRTLLAEIPGPPDIAKIFADAAHALAAMARTVADAGRVNSPPELDAVAARLLDSYTSERDVVAMASLAPAGFDSIAHRGTPPAPVTDVQPVPVELVGVGDHLLIVADALAHPTSPAARDLRLFVLHRTLSTMPARSATGRFLAPLAEAITSAIAARVATQKPDAFIAMLRDCGRFLSESANATDRGVLNRHRDALAASFGVVAKTAEVSQEVLRPRDAPGQDDTVSIESLAPSVDDIVPIEALAPDDDSIVPIASLAPDEDDVVPIESLAPDATAIPEVAPGEPTRLEVAFTRRRAVASEHHDDTPSLAGLLGVDIVPVGAILYRGAAALTRADEIRAEILAMLAETTVSLQGLRPLIHELLDLVPLARDAA